MENMPNLIKCLCIKVKTILLRQVLLFPIIRTVVLDRGMAYNRHVRSGDDGSQRACDRRHATLRHSSTVSYIAVKLDFIFHLERHRETITML